jgi:DnaJ-class molecular chaperone
MSGTSNPLLSFVETRLTHAFLKSGSTSIYQETLGISLKANPAELRAAYKSVSLRLHPDKIRQRFQREVTEEETAQLLLAKEAYQILR